MCKNAKATGGKKGANSLSKEAFTGWLLCRAYNMLSITGSSKQMPSKLDTKGAEVAWREESYGWGGTTWTQTGA